MVIKSMGMLAKALALERKRQNLTYQELGERSGVSAPCIHGWENQRRNARLDVILPVLDQLGLVLVLRRKKEAAEDAH